MGVALIKEIPLLEISEEKIDDYVSELEQLAKKLNV